MNYSLDTLLYGMQFRKLLEKKMAPLETEYGLNKVDIQILFFLRHSGKHDTSSDMMQLKMFTRGHISQALARLHKLGYIRMEQDAADRRCTHNFLTPQAYEMIERVENGYAAIHEIILNGITPEERRVLNSAAQKISQNISAVLSSDH